MLVISTTFLSGCANKTGPTGGPKDEDPPQLIVSSPADGQLNFAGSEIVLEFDEYVKLDKAKEQILITPRYDGDYDIKQRRDRIILEFDSAFAENTTYTINFRQSIVDITEGNPAERLSIAFSTGPYIDSLSVSGYVQHVLSGKPARQATIALYQESDTATILDGLPLYFTETNDSGRYVINNIKAGSYRAYALMDENRNLTAETDNESYGFYPDTLQLNQDLENINMNLVFLDISEFDLISARPSGTTYDIRLNKYITDYRIEPEDTTLDLSHYYADIEHEVISVFNNGLITDSARIYLTATDSIGQTLQDTLWVKFAETGRDPEQLVIQTHIKQIPVNRPVLDMRLTFSKPVPNITKDSIYIYLDSLYTIPYDSLDPQWNVSRTALTFSYTFPDSLFRTSSQTQNSPQAQDQGPTSRPPSFVFGQGAFIGIEGDSTQAQSPSLPFVQSSSLAILIITINASSEQYFIQLLDQNYEVVAQRSPASTIRFNNLPPGQYMLRAVFDLNNNGQWDPGNILLNQLPENIVYFKARNGDQIISLRANFEVSETFGF